MEFAQRRPVPRALSVGAVPASTGAVLSKTSVVRRVLWSLAASVLGLLVLANLFLNLWLADLVNAAQDDVTMSYDRAWTVWPGHVWATELRLVGHDSHTEWLLELSEVRATIELLPLPTLTFRAHDAVAERARFRVRKTRPLAELCAAPAGELPPIPGLSDPQLEDCEAQPDTARPPIPPTDPAEIWRVDLARMHVRVLDELWIEGVHLTGLAELTGGLWLWPTQALEVRPVELRLTQGVVASATTAALSELTLSLRGALARLSLVDTDAAAALAQLTLTASVTATLPSLAPLRSLLPEQAELTLRGGPGALAGTLQVVGGRVGPATALSLRVPELAARLDAVEASGRASLTLTGAAGRERAPAPSTSGAPAAPEASDTSTSTRLVVDLGPATVRSLEHPAARADVRELSLVLESAEGELARPRRDVRGRLRLRGVRIASLGAYDALLPTGGAVALLAGSATASADVVMVDAEHLHGRLELHAREVRLGLVGRELHGVVHVDGRLVHGDLVRGVLNVDGTQVAIAELGLTGTDRAPRWWAHADVTKSRLRLSGSPALELHLVVHLADLRPIWALYDASAWMPGWIQAALSGEDTRGLATLSLGGGELRLEKLEVAGEGVALEGLVHLGPLHSRAALLVSHGPLSVSIAAHEGDTDVTVMDATAHFRRRIARWRKPLPMDEVQ
jgi:hypothetical protein